MILHSETSVRMATGQGLSLFEGDLKINTIHEEDEDDIEQERIRNEELDKQLEGAFDESGDDGNILPSSEEESEDEQNSHFTNAMGEREDADQHGQQIFMKTFDTDPFKLFFPVNSSNDKSDSTNSPEKSIEDAYRQAAMGGGGDADRCGQQIFMKTPDSDPPQLFFPNNISNDRSESYISSEESIEDAYRHAENDTAQLQVLYEVRLHEIEQLNSQLQKERQVHQDLKRKCALLDAEKERAVLSRTEANKLLVTSKEEIDRLQNEVQSLKQTILTLEKDKTKSDELLELSKVEIVELEQRIALMERCDPNKSIVKQTEITIKNLKNSHQHEVHQLQRQLESLNKKLEKKEEDYSMLEKKLAELQRAYDVMIVDKANTINQLARSLEESQAQCHQLMADNVTADNIRLQTQLEDAVREKEQLNLTVKNLQVECGSLRTDIAQYESISKLTLPENNSSSDETDSIVQMGMSSKPKRSNLSMSDRNSSIKVELHRALLNLSAKRAEISQLQEIVKEKESEIQEMKQQERDLLAQTSTLTEQLDKTKAELRSFQDNKEKNDHKAEEIAALKADMAEIRKEKAALEREKLEVQGKLDDLMKRFDADKRQEISDYNKEYLKFHDETVAKVKKKVEEEADLKIREYSIRLDQSLKEMNEVKEMYVTVCKAKEKLVLSLHEISSKFKQVIAERDQLAGELQKNNEVQEQLARRLNETTANNVDEQAFHMLEKEKDNLKAELEKCVEMRDQLARKTNNLKRENTELNAEIKRIKSSKNISPQGTVAQIDAECRRLQEELSAMSARHTLELSSVHSELQGARDRAVQLEKFETEIKSIQQDRDMLKTKCDEKEVQIKKLIESRKRPPVMVSVATETEIAEELTKDKAELIQLERRHRRELLRCREEYKNALVEMEQAHQEALVTASNKNKEDIDRILEKHHHILEAVKVQLEQREAALNNAHKQELLAIEEHTKELTIKYFAEKMKDLEAKFSEKARVDPAIVESLHKELIEKTKEIESLKHRLAGLSEECQQKIMTLQNQIDADRDSASQLMVQWAQEIKNIQGELKLKEAIIDDQRTKLERAKSVAKRYRDKLIKTNKEIVSQSQKKCEEYKAEMIRTIEEREKEVFENIRKLEGIYEEREKELKKMIKKNKNIT